MLVRKKNHFTINLDVYENFLKNVNLPFWEKSFFNHVISVYIKYRVHKHDKTLYMEGKSLRGKYRILLRGGGQWETKSQQQENIKLPLSEPNLHNI